MQVKFRIDIEPQAKGRPRFSRRGHAYTPDNTRRFERCLITESLKHAPQVPIEGPISLSLQFDMPIPKSKRVHVGEPHVVKPDLDNLIKSAVDPLNGVFWKDDNLVHLVNARKVYSESPGIEYIINY